MNTESNGSIATCAVVPFSFANSVEWWRRFSSIWRFGVAKIDFAKRITEPRKSESPDSPLRQLRDCYFCYPSHFGCHGRLSQKIELSEAGAGRNRLKKHFKRPVAKNPPPGIFHMSQGRNDSPWGNDTRLYAFEFVWQKEERRNA